MNPVIVGEWSDTLIPEHKHRHWIKLQASMIGLGDSKLKND
jgi:hypothetical protein